MATVSVFVWKNAFGILLCPWVERGPDSIHSFVTGSAQSLSDFTQPVLIAALREIFQNLTIDQSDTTVMFFDGNDWNASGSPPDNKGKLLMTVQFPVSTPAAPVP